MLVTASKGDFSFQANTLSREKGVPTGQYGTIFGDNRTRTTDELSLASVSFDRALSNGASVSTRLHAGRYWYLGEYPYTDLPANQDEVLGEWWGMDVNAARKIGSRQFLTFGAEYQDNFKQIQKNFDPEPYVLYTDVSGRSARWGVFAQDEIKLAEPVMLYAGARLDHYEGFGYATSPRLALIYTPSPKTTFKALAGRAFRAPNEFELHFEALGYKANPLLEPEHIETLELIAQHFVGGGVQISASAFRNRLTGLTDQLLDPADSLVRFVNLGDIRAKGLELALEVNRGHGSSGQLSYSLQRTEEHTTGAELTNSPGQIVQLQLRSAVPRLGAIAALDAQYMSARRTLAGNSANGHTLTNLSLTAPKALGRLDLSAALYNVFATRYGDPVGDGYVQDVIRQDGRNVRVRATLHY
jgi:iron complex outermembrane receptor protein